MADHKSALKRARQSKVKRLRNVADKTRAKGAVKTVRAAVAGNDANKARETLREAVSILHKTASKGVIHKKKAARKISRLARQVNKLASS